MLLGPVNNESTHATPFCNSPIGETMTRVHSSIRIFIYQPHLLRPLSCSEFDRGLQIPRIFEHNIVLIICD